MTDETNHGTNYGPASGPNMANPYPVTSGPSFVQRTRKALAGGIAGLVGGGIGTTITSALSDGQITGAEGWQIASVAVGLFFVGFGAVFYAPANAPA